MKSSLPSSVVVARISSISARLDGVKKELEECGYAAESVEKYLQIFEEITNDVAGVRVICSFVEDIYYLADMLAAQDDLNVIQVKDYIKHPKDNGYRSLHLIIGIPIFLSSEKKYVRVEVQFRTIAMDFWASLDHKLKYKKNVKNPELIAAELKKCADTISSVDLRMQEIRNMMEEGEM